jgi:hypothetical protein
VTLFLETFEGYCRTTYEVAGPDGPFRIRIGQPSPEADAILQSSGHSHWVIITACNPLSQPLPDDENQRRTAALRERIGHNSQSFWGAGTIPDEGDWPSEPGFFVVLSDVALAWRWAQDFEQHAIVIGQAGQPAQLAFPARSGVEAVLAQARESRDPLIAQAAGQALVRDPA